MCKNLFNKNQNYTIKELGEALMQALPGKWSDMHSCATNISRYIKEKDIKPVNSRRVTEYSPESIARQSMSTTRLLWTRDRSR